MTEQEIRRNAPSGATHYAKIIDTNEVIYLWKDRRVIGFCFGYKTNEQLGVIKPL